MNIVEACSGEAQAAAGPDGGTVAGSAGDINWRTMVDSELIVVADDHPVFRDGLKRLLAAASPNATIIEAGTMDEVLAIASQPPAPSLFVLDLLFPGMRPKETLPHLRERFPRSSIVIVSMIDDEATVQQIMRLGADGFVGKAVSSQRIVDGIMAVKAGQFVVIRAEQGASQSADGTSVLDLTPRQKDVLQCLAQDKSNKEIGRMLSISPFTVRIHVSALLRILQVESRALAAVKARALGF
jgi:DNA-binding NarL/FixJ family response regulator